MKIGLYSDPHFSSQEVTCGNRYNSQSLHKMAAAYQEFEQAGCRMAICLGDLTDTEDTKDQEIFNMKKIATFLSFYSLPTMVAMGNHDAYVFEAEEFYRLLGEGKPRDMVVEDHTLMFLSANFNPDGSPYQPHDFQWYHCYIPTEGLAERLAAAEGDVTVFLHQNLDPNCPADHRPVNADEVCRILTESGKVKAVYQGHYHWGADNVVDGIRYVTLPAMCCYENTHKIIEI